MTVFNHRNRKLLIAFGIAVLAHVVVVASFALTIFIDGTTLNHIQTIEFKNQIYHLALAHNITGGGDAFYEEYLVYECGRDGICHFVDGSSIIYFAVEVLPATLLVEPEQQILYLRSGDESRIIAP